MTETRDETPENTAGAEAVERTTREPIFNLPAILVGFVGSMTLIHLVRIYLLSAETDRYVLWLFAFIPARYLHPLSEQDWGWLAGPVTYSFLHGGFLHLIFNCLWLIAFASTVVKRIGNARFAVFWVLSAIASAFFQAFATGFADSYLIGASGVVSATVGAACRFSLPFSGTPAMRWAEYAPRLGIFEAMRNRSVVVFVAIWAVSNVLVVYGAGMPAGDYNIAWQAHVGGLLFGYLTFGFFDPGPRR